LTERRAAVTRPTGPGRFAIHRVTAIIQSIPIAIYCHHSPSKPNGMAASPISRARGSRPHPACAASVIDRERVQRQGALALRQTSAGCVVEAVKPRGMDRPWRPAAGGGCGACRVLRAEPSVPRGQDATPSETNLQADD
jgi:hypothetical protein